MSSDLLKEFGDLQENPWKLEESKQHQGSADDDFGDFEQPENRPKSGSLHERSINGASTSHVQDGQIAVPNDDEEDFADDSWGGSQQPNLDWNWQAPISSQFESTDHSKERNDSVLFDAEAEYAQAKSPPSAPRVAHKIAKPAVVEIQDADFAAWEPEDAPENAHQIKALAPETRLDTRQKAIAIPTRASDNGPPPTNVPPPSSLLSLSDSLLKTFGRSSGQSANGASQVPEETAIDGTCSDLRAIGRILAGRKSRWNRDSFLSQSMRIGQAGTQGGMKLTKVDKTESRREDQEAAELLKTWKQHAGALRLGLAKGKNLQMPELAASMPVRVAKPGEGALSAPKPCFLCGLKREERVLKVDAKVEDGFGLWWVEHWGHHDCVQFWNRHERALPQR